MFSPSLGGESRCIHVPTVVKMSTRSGHRVRNNARAGRTQKKANENVLNTDMTRRRHNGFFAARGRVTWWRQRHHPHGRCARSSHGRPLPQTWREPFTHRIVRMSENASTLLHLAMEWLRNVIKPTNTCENGDWPLLLFRGHGCHANRKHVNYIILLRCVFFVLTVSFRPRSVCLMTREIIAKLRCWRNSQPRVIALFTRGTLGAGHFRVGFQTHCAAPAV